jgi:restriction system protein
MSKCLWCNKSGLFMQVDKNGLCIKCHNIVIDEVKQRYRIINKSLNSVRTSTTFKTQLNHIEIVIQQAKQLLRYESKGITTTEPEPSKFIEIGKSDREKLIIHYIDSEIEKVISKSELASSPKVVVNAINACLIKIRETKSLLENPNIIAEREERIKNLANKMQLEKQNNELSSEPVEEMTAKAEFSIKELHNILKHSLSINSKVDWKILKHKDTFKIEPKKLFKNSCQYDFIHFDSFGRPIDFSKRSYPNEPTLKSIEKQYNFVSRISGREKIKKEFTRVFEEWQKNVDLITKDNVARENLYNNAIAIFEEKKKEFKKQYEMLDDIKVRYEKSDPIAIEEYCDLILKNSEYPDYFPKNWVLEYRKEGHILIVEYYLPSPTQFPNIESYRYIKSRNEINKKELSKSDQKSLYDNSIYQICIRTIHELFEADTVNALDAVAFNGLVTNINPATGIEEIKVIMSIIANKDKFMSFDLYKIDPKATFKHLKGVSAITLIDLTPIPPIIKMDKYDKRFIIGKEIVSLLDESVNLAAMDWGDFEHLIRELFEKEFISNGGEVKVTQASSDGGVDAIAFDPDPIRGGKIIIQAKRYTNVVGVSAVRDLYGTVMNEGATKGILVTTADYGKDSYEFAKDKPLTLLNGSNLLALLEKHGYKSRINITEAKKILNEKSDNTN